MIIKAGFPAKLKDLMGGDATATGLLVDDTPVVNSDIFDWHKKPGLVQMVYLTSLRSADNGELLLVKVFPVDPADGTTLMTEEVHSFSVATVAGTTFRNNFPLYYHQVGRYFTVQVVADGSGDTFTVTVRTTPLEEKN